MEDLCEQLAYLGTMNLYDSELGEHSGYEFTLIGRCFVSRSICDDGGVQYDLGV